MPKPLKLKSGKDVLAATNAYLAGKALPTTLDLNKGQTEAELKLALAECLRDALKLAKEARVAATSIEQCLIHTGNFPAVLSDLTDISIYLRGLAEEYGVLWRLVRAGEPKRKQKVKKPHSREVESDLVNEILETGDFDGKHAKDWTE